MSQTAYKTEHRHPWMLYTTVDQASWQQSLLSLHLEVYIWSEDEVWSSISL